MVDELVAVHCERWLSEGLFVAELCIGGTNETQFGHEETLRKPTLAVDGYKLVDQGKIQT